LRKVRHAAITREIIEMVSGAEALQRNGIPVSAA
jgi:F0F1-type ATP synthase gamma subunit